MIVGQRYPKSLKLTFYAMPTCRQVGNICQLKACTHFILTSYGPICLNSSAIKGEVMLWPESSANSRLPVEPDSPLPFTITGIVLKVMVSSL